MHRIHNFAEELSLTLGDLGRLPMEQADAATTTFVVTHIAKRDVGKCEQLIRKLLRRHLMESEAVLRRL